MKKPVRLRCRLDLPVGSLVRCRSAEGGELASSFLIFGTPVAAFLAAALAAHFAGLPDGGAFLSGVAALGLVFFILRRLDGRGGFLSYLPEVVGVVDVPWEAEGGMGTRNALADAAFQLAEEIREGHGEHVAGLDIKPASTCPELIAELERRCPGFSRDEYEQALADGLFASR